MKRILVLGATGKLGKVLTDVLIRNNFNVTALVRNPQKLTGKSQNLTIIEGNVTDDKVMSQALEGIDVVISVLGHGIRTKFPIQEKTMKILIPLMEKKKIKRLIVVTGEGLLLKDDNSSLFNKLTSRVFSIIDPYRMSDAIVQQNLIEKSKLDYTIVRTPVHSNKDSWEIKYSGYNHPSIFQTVSRQAVSNFIVELIEKHNWVRQSPIIY